MDDILEFCDRAFFTPYVYPQSWPEDNILRQFFFSLMFLATLGGYLLYFSVASFSYYFIFDHRHRKHPKFLKDQEWKEIKVAAKGVPLMVFLSVLCFLLEVRGYSRLLNSSQESCLGWFSIPVSTVTFILFTDCLIYWIHRGLHHPLIYKEMHKTHHLWKVPTPFASHAFHPIDGFLQSLPYHLYVFLFPMPKYLYLGMYFLVNIWTVSIHDGDYRVPDILKSSINGAAHHMDHHLFYNFNYGQFFTLWDRIGGTFRSPSSFEGDSPLDQVLRKELASKLQ
jgi:lathosterol oxidase